MIFTIPAKDKNSVKTIIGDEKSSLSDFLPSIKLSRWDEEVSFKVGFDVSAIPKVQKVFSNLGNDNYKLSTPLLDFKIYPLPPNKQMEDGGLEFEIILKSKPPTNKISMPIETAGLDFFYQPELTTEEKAQGDRQPENVIGSYAVYHSTKKDDYSLIGGKNYKTGKAFHIYRPQMIDAIGTKEWGVLNINVGSGTLTVTIPQAFLDSAVYPIRHAAGLTFGYTTKGANGWAFAANALHGSLATSPAGSNVGISISCIMETDGATNMKGVITLASTKVIIANGVGGATAIGASQAIVTGTSTFGTSPTLAASTSYVLEAIFSVTAYPYYDAAAGQGWEDSSNSYTTPTNPTDGEENNRRASIYCTYEAAGGVAYTLDAAAGSYAITGQAASPLMGRKLAVEAGSYGVNGQDAGAYYGRKLAIEAGAYALSGQDQGLLHNKILGIAAGSYTVTGQDASVLYGRKISTDAGAYDLTGQDAGVLHSKSISAEAGAYVLTGQDLALLLGRKILAEGGAYVLTGQDVTLIYTPAGAYTLVAEGGSYVLTGQDIGLLLGRKLAAEAGAYLVSGQDAAALLGRILSAEAGSYAVTGSDASLLLGRLLSVLAGEYAITGQDITLSYSGVAAVKKIIAIVQDIYRIKAVVQDIGRVKGEVVDLNRIKALLTDETIEELYDGGAFDAVPSGDIDCGAFEDEPDTIIDLGEWN